MPQSYLIGELAMLTNVTPRTIRYYESLGLLQSNQEKKGSYRHYEESQLHRLQNITRMKDAGLTLEEIAEIIDLLDENSSSQIEGKRKILSILHTRLEELDTKINSMQILRQDLKQNIAKIEAYLEQELE